MTPLEEAEALLAANDLRISVFVQGADRKLWERYWNGAGWSWIDTGLQVDGEPLPPRNEAPVGDQRPWTCIRCDR